MPESDSAIDSFVAARRLRPSWPGIAETLQPRTITEGYDLQKAVHQRLIDMGDQRVGWKVGSTSAAGQARFGLSEPVYAGLFASGRSESVAEGLARPLARPSVECEIAFILAADIDPHRLSQDVLVGAIGACHIACEIIDNRYGEPLAHGVPSLVADDFFQSGFVIGPANPYWREQNLADAEGFIEVGDQRIPGAAGNALSANDSLRWLAGALARSGQSLRTGDIVLTGTIPPPTPVPLPARSVRMGITGFPVLAFA
jgi:2-keto-4-pentenoate hydratase